MTMLMKFVTVPLTGLLIIATVSPASSQNLQRSFHQRWLDRKQSATELAIPYKEWRRQQSPRATGKHQAGEGEALRVLGDVGEAWVRNYPSSSIGSTIFRATDVTVDAAQNVYVTGYGGIHPVYDYVTLKYNSVGTLQWSAVYNGPANGDDKAVAIDVDGSGNVYVTGYSTGSGSGYDYATVKYNSSGTQQWVQRHNGGGNGTDQATAIAVDGSGNVYVTGFSLGSGSPTPGDDYVTIKYNTSGTPLWTMSYNSSNETDVATAIGLDGSGNVYVTGFRTIVTISQGNPVFRTTFATVKYNANGALQWVVPYAGESDHDAVPNDLVVDGSGNVYVTGRTENSSTFVADFATVKYNTSGTQQWANRYNAPFSEYNEAVDVAVDVSGNVFVTGYTGGSPNWNYTTIKYGSTGVQSWLRQYSGIANDDDTPTGLALDTNGDVYVTGFSWTGFNYDALTIKYTNAGTQDWLIPYSSASGYNDLAAAVAVDASRNVYIAGESYNSFGAIVTTVKYSEAINARVKVYLQGPYNSTANLMSNGLRTSGTLAGHFPGVPIPAQAVDSITIEIRSDVGPTNPSMVRFFAPAWLMTDGTIRNFADTTKDYVSFGASSGNYYLVVWHRNHLAVMSSTNPLLQVTPIATWDFSTGLTQAYLSGHIQIDTSPARYGTRGGDGNGDGGVDAIDRNTVWRPANGSAGYLRGDFNLDGGVDAIDRNTVWRPNNGSGTTVP